jgi:hypothetical protein
MDGGNAYIRIPTTDVRTKTGFCQEKNGLPGISLQRSILDLRNETIWSGFLWYLTYPQVTLTCIKSALHNGQCYARLPDQFLTFFWDYLDKNPVYQGVKKLVIYSSLRNL